MNKMLMRFPGSHLALRWPHKSPRQAAAGQAVQLSTGKNDERLASQRVGIIGRSQDRVVQKRDTSCSLPVVGGKIWVR